MAPVGCRTQRQASRDYLYITWSSHTSHISHHVIGHITSQHTLQKQVRRPLIVVASFTWLLWVSSNNNSYLRKNHNGDTQIAIQPSQGPPLSNPIQLKWEKQTPASHLYATKVTCLLKEPVSRKRTSNVGPSRFIPQYRRNKKRPREEAIWISTPTNSFVFYSRSHLHIDLAQMPLLGNVAWETKNFLRTPKIYLGEA